MSVVNVTMTTDLTCHYWFEPEAVLSASGSGALAPNIVEGWIGANADGSAATLTVGLDASYAWDITLRFRNAPPVIFEGFQPGTGGDLLTMLSAQGWTSL